MRDDQTDALLFEYRELKREQNARIGDRDHLLYATLGVCAGVVAFSMSDHGSVSSLLALPAATFVLGVVSHANDTKISAIRDYIRDHLGPGISGAANVFEWENFHRVGLRRKALDLTANLLTFVFPGIFAIVRYLTVTGAPTPQIWAAIAVDALLVLWLAVEIVFHIDLPSDNSRKPAKPVTVASSA